MKISTAERVLPVSENSAGWPREFFETEHLKSDLKGRSVRGGAVTMTTQAVKFLLQTGSTIMLARLLTPYDYGLIAMVTAITGFVMLFQNMGLSLATIQRANITHSQVSNLFWLNAAMGVVLGLIVAGCAPIISWFYGEPRLCWITIALAGTFLFSGLTIQHQSLLSRQMRFKTIALIEIISMSVGITTGITMAWYGAEYWALVGLSVASALSSVVLVWIFCGWRPGLPAPGAEIWPMIKFGGQITGFDIVNYFARNFDNILLGRFWGSNVLGLYSRAYNIMMLPISQVRGSLNSVAIPALSHIQNDPIRYKSYYIKLITLLAFITMPLMTFLFVCGDQVIYLLLGSQWLGVIDIFKILCINTFAQPVMGTAGLVLISLGQSKRYFIIGTLNSIIVVISFLLGLPWGAIGVATAYTIAAYVMSLPTLWYCFRRSPISIMDFFSAIFRPVIASFCMGVVVFASYLFLVNQPGIMVLGGCFVIGGLMYLLALVLLPGGIQMLREFHSVGLLLLRTKARQ
jgi:PST family polysaccharide transporter